MPGYRIEGQAVASSEWTSLKQWNLARPEGGDGVSKVEIWKKMYHTFFSQLSKELSAGDCSLRLRRHGQFATLPEHLLLAHSVNSVRFQSFNYCYVMWEAEQEQRKEKFRTPAQSRVGVGRRGEERELHPNLRSGKILELLWEAWSQIFPIS